MLVRPLTRLAAVLVASSALVAVSAPLSAAAAAPAAVADPPDAALEWIEGQLAADGGYLTTSFQGDPDVQSFDDWGLTIDAVLALAAGGRGDGAAAMTATELVEDNVATYVTGGFDPEERYAGAIAKALLMAEIQGTDPGDFGGYDLVDELLARLQPAGADAGRFQDLTGFGDFSNGFGQALAVLALARTGDGVPPVALQFLLDQQCPGGSFRGDYTSSGGCTADADATVDATGFALQALVAVEPTCAVRQAVTDAVASLVAGQNAGGAFGGETGSNTNSTGLAAVALRSLGQTGAADAAAGFITGLQLDDGDDLGAVALNAAGLASAADGVQILERDGFRRASTQGVLALGLPSYGEIGTARVDPAAYAPCTTPPPPVEPSGTISAPSVVAGGQLTVRAVGFDPGETVDATLHSTPIDLGSVVADAQGAVTLTFTVPADLEPGQHTVDLVGQTSGTRVSVGFEVLAAPGTGGPGTLPATGRTTGAQAGAGMGLLGLGLALVALGRRRQAARR